MDNIKESLASLAEETKKKKCSICKNEKSLNDFFRSRVSKDGRKGTCKECQKGLEKGTIKSSFDPHAERNIRNSLSGQRFGKLVAGKTVRRKTPNGRLLIYYECFCDCGGSKIVRGSFLTLGTTRSCGCLYKEAADTRWSSKRVIQVKYRRILSYYKTNATKRKILWNISPEDFSSIIEKDCFYCGSSPKPRMFAGKEICCNGLDRVENDGNYSLDNVVPCCSQCNVGKYCQTVEEFVDWAKRVAGREKEIRSNVEYFRNFGSSSGTC